MKQALNLKKLEEQKKAPPQQKKFLLPVQAQVPASKKRPHQFHQATVVRKLWEVAKIKRPKNQ